MHQLLPPSLEEIRSLRLPVRDVNSAHSGSLGTMDRMALYITDRVGTMGFFLVIIAWTGVWLGWNLLAPKRLQFDPPMAFVFWLFISNMLQIFLMPLLMVGQNLQGRHAELRAQSDYEVNLKAEREIEAVLHHLEYQNRLLASLASNLGVPVAPAPPANPAPAQEAIGVVPQEGIS